jgi:Uma2 family endonuclease
MSVETTQFDAMPDTALMTAEELLALNLPDKRTELIRGRLVVREPAGFLHGDVAARILVSLAVHVNANKLGRTLAAETGFTLERNPDTVRAPDVAFVRADRVPNPLPRGFAELAPDLAVEVLSPDDRPGEVLSKVGTWLRAGTRLIWVVDPVKRTARIYRADGTMAERSGDDLLDGEEIVPGFSSPLSALLD